MLLAAVFAYHLAYHSGPIAVHVAYKVVTDQYGLPGITGGEVTIDNGSRNFTVDLAKLMPISVVQHILLPRDVNDGCGGTQPIDVVANYVVVESVWVGKGCRAVGYFIDANSGAIVETVDLDHRWNHRLDIQPAHFKGQPIGVERVDHVALPFGDYDVEFGLKIKQSAWQFVIVHGRDANGNAYLYAYELANGYMGGRPDPGWNIFPTVGSTVYVGRLSGVSFADYHPDPQVLRLSAGDDAFYAERQEPTSPRAVRVIQRNQWFALVDEDADKMKFPQALDAFERMLLLEDDPSLYKGEKALYDQCRAMVAEVQAEKISAASARAAWLNNGCRPVR